MSNHCTNRNQLAALTLVPAFFFIPISAAPAYLSIFIATLLALTTAKSRAQLSSSFKHPLSLAFYAFAGSALLSLLWTENLEQGYEFAERYLIYLFFPLILITIQKQYFHLYLGAFLAGVGLTEFLSYGLWLDLWDWDRGYANNAINDDHLPFAGHILYSPIAAFAAFIMLNRLFEQWSNTNWPLRLLLMFFISTIVMNLFFTHGRTGMVAFLALVTFLIITRLYHYKLKALLAATMVSIMLPISAYYTLDDFQKRVDIGYQDIIELTENKNAISSIGNRVMNWWGGLQMFSQYPLAGVGLGDFEQHYIAFMDTQNIQYVSSVNPHNQYIFTASTSGLLGLFPLLAIFLILIRTTYQDYRQQREHLMIKAGLILLFLVICLAESYLWRSNTSLMLIMFCAILFERNPKNAK